MILALAAAFCLIEGPLPPPDAAPCSACTCCKACPCSVVVKASAVKVIAEPAPVPAPAKTWVRLVNEPGVEAFGVLGPDGYVTGIAARRYWSAPPVPVTYAPRYYGSACANGSCPRP